MNTADYRRLVALGLTPDQVAGVMEMFDEKEDARKAQGRERWQRWDARRKANVSQRKPTTANGSRAVEDKPLPSEIEPQVKRESARAVRLAEDWSLPDDWRAEAVGMGLPPQRCDVEAATMRDWSRSNPNGAKRDWRAAWRNWVRRAVEKLGQQRGPPEKNALSNGFKNVAASMRLQSEIQPRESSPGIRKALPDLSVVSGGRG